MPYIDVKLTKKLTFAEETSLKAQLGKAISVFPGKSEQWLMCNVSDEQKIWFRGDNSSDSAFVEVKLFGNVDKDSAERFTGELCSYFEQNLKIDASRVYVRYEGSSVWGWNGSNF